MWANGSGEEVFLKVNNVFSLFYYHFRFEKDGVLRLNILKKKIKIFLSKDALCQIWQKSACKVVLEREQFEKFTTTTTDYELILISLLHPSSKRAKEYLQLRPF